MWTSKIAFDVTKQLRRLVIIGSGNNLVPSGNKSSPEAMMTEIYVALQNYLAIMN